ERVAAALVKAASRLIIRPVRRLNVNASAARGGDLSLGFFQQQLANALTLLARLDGDPVHIKAADCHGVLAETDIADSVSLLLSENELVARCLALVEPRLNQLNCDIDFTQAEQ